MATKTRNDLDLAWKDALNTFLAEFLQFFLPHVHGDVDWSEPVEFLNSELRRLRRGLKGRRRHADLVARVRLLGGGKAVVVIHVEVQSQVDEQLPLRMKIYSDRLFDRHRCPVYSVAVLGDPTPGWRPSSYESQVWDCRALLEYPVLKLLEWKPRRAELEASPNPFALVVATHLAVLETRPHQPARLEKAMRLARLMAARGFSREEVAGLFHVLEAMMAMTDELYQVFEVEVARLEEETGVQLITRSERKGLEKGLEKGREEGLAEGRRASILDVSAARFGKFPRGLQAALQKVSDLEALQRLTQAAATVETPARLLEAVRQESRHREASAPGS